MSDSPLYIHRGISLIKKRTFLGSYRRPMPRVLWWSWGSGRFNMAEVPLYNASWPEGLLSLSSQAHHLTTLPPFQPAISSSHLPPRLPKTLQ